MKLIHNVLAAGFAVAAISVAACSSQHGDTGSGSAGGSAGSVGNVGHGGQDGVGQVSMNLDIGPGVSLTSFTYTITATSGTPPLVYTNTVTIGQAQSLEFVVGGIVAGSYTLTINGSDSAGDPCSGSTTTAFTITAGNVTQTTLAITCVAPADASAAADVNTGSLEVDASVSLDGTAPPTCPGINSFSISPAELASGQSAALTLSDTDPTATILWTVTPAGGGVFGTADTATATTATTTFTCTNTAPQVTVIATVTPANAASAALCANQPFETMKALVNCEAPTTFSCPPQFGDKSLTLECGTAPNQVCVNPLTDVNNCGTCGNVCPAAPAGDTVVCNAGTCGVAVPKPTVCTTAPCAASQVTCSNNAANTNGVCTATEAAFVNLDLASGATTAAGDATTNAASCYACLVTNHCVDVGTHFTGRECEDLTGTFTNATATVPAASTCDAVVSCVTATSCAASDSSFCYCGTGGGPSTQCVTAAGGAAANGPCISQEVAGLPDAQTDTSDNVGTFYGTKSDPSGLANDIFACATTNSCTQCL
jgi:hypothetical protein